MHTFEYDDRHLRQLFAALQPKERRKAINGTLRVLGKRLRQEVLANIDRSGVNRARKLHRGVQMKLTKRGNAGFYVTVFFRKGTDTKKGRGMHTNRFGKDKPVLFWMEDGTALRYRKDATGRQSKFTGRMPEYRFVDKAKKAKEGELTSSMGAEMLKSVQKIAMRYGCY